eukprot:TRINITY_DN3530_c0_g1_i1.p2 TRINITY_DN3530_c0_g1~~TRINITY_DN3530_c0_g1_i1.p2  ORF type:complete len:230 (-),score=75.66 TRINITY_DN3530_c0_g1_i1:537-1226(-)
MSELKVVSYNMLGHVYLAGHLESGNVDYLKTPRELADWRLRQDMLMKQFDQFDADLYLLQEADRFGFAEQFGEYFSSKGYDFVIQDSKKARPGHPVCLVTVFRSSKLQHLSSDHRSRTLVSALSVIATPQADADDEKKQHQQQQKVVYVINVHLEGHWTLEGKRLEQLSSAFSSLEKLWKKHEAPVEQVASNGNGKKKKKQKKKKGAAEEPEEERSRGRTRRRKESICL